MESVECGDAGISSVDVEGWDDESSRSAVSMLDSMEHVAGDPPQISWQSS